MKKTLICIALIFVLLSSYSASVSAEVNSDALKEEFLYYYYNGSPETFPDAEVYMGEIIELEDKVIFTGYGLYAPFNMEYAKRFGDWYCYLPYYWTPSSISVYVKFSDEIYTLDEAWDDGILTDITPVLNLVGKDFYPVGDVNQDKEINVKDATELQKYLACMVRKWYISYDGICDLNDDGKINIRDVTAIQKSLAKIEI